MLHDRPTARDLWAKLSSSDDALNRACLVIGEAGPVARLHPSIKGVWGGQSAGGSIVSFNLDAFSSYGHEQGDNAQVSEVAAFKYTTALNRLLSKDSSHRIQIGDASTVFWADAGDAGDPELAGEAESLFLQLVDPGGDDGAATQRIAAKLKDIRDGKPLTEIEPRLDGVRFYVLGLAPNAARISIRFYFEDSFGVLTRHYQRYLQDMALEPGPREKFPPLWRYLTELAVLGKRENVPPNLAGEWMRAILSGARYPMTLLSTVLQRIRSDGEIGALRVAMLRALLVRNFNLSKEAPVALDTENTNRGYLLGRLFAVYERAQLAALGDVNASIKDKFYGSASAQPRKVFHMLDRGSANHLSKLGKQSPGYRVVLERTLSTIMDQMQPGADPFPASLSAEEQALFGLGYYHQRNEFFRKSSTNTGDQETAA
jgi:CRISPR-associated protein Csd1